MANKKRKDERPQYKPTKRHLSNLQKQKRRQRLIAIVGSVVIAAVVLLVGVGFVTQWFVPVYLQLQKTVLEVDSKEFNVDYYVNALDYYTGGEFTYAQYFLDSILDTIGQQEAVKQKAAEMGYSVADDEVKDVIENAGLDDNKAVRDFVAYSLLLGKVKEGEFASQVPNMAEHRNLLAMFAESKSTADEIIIAVETGENFGELAAYSLDSYAKAQNGEIGWRPYGVLEGLLDSEGIDDAVFDAEEGVWTTFKDSEKYKDIGYWLIEILERNEDDNTVHVRSMLLSSEEEALSVKEKLEAGEDFGDLAVEFSQLADVEENLGDLDFISANSGNYTTIFADFVFNDGVELNEVSQPLADDGLSTTGGCWLFVVEEVEERDMDDENSQLLIGDALNDWVTKVVDSSTAEVVNYLDDDIKLFALNRLSGS